MKETERKRRSTFTRPHKTQSTVAGSLLKEYVCCRTKWIWPSNFLQRRVSVLCCFWSVVGWSAPLAYPQVVRPWCSGQQAKKHEIFRVQWPMAVRSAAGEGKKKTEKKREKETGEPCPEPGLSRMGHKSFLPKATLLRTVESVRPSQETIPNRR